MKTVPVPPEAFIDLVNLRLVRIGGSGGKFSIHFEGSDAGEGYEGFIVVEGPRVVCREVWAGEFPEYRESKTFSAGNPVEAHSP